jgi:hypothetical protein
MVGRALLRCAEGMVSCGSLAYKLSRWVGVMLMGFLVQNSVGLAEWHDRLLRAWVLTLLDCRCSASLDEVADAGKKLRVVHYEEQAAPAILAGGAFLY